MNYAPWLTLDIVVLRGILKLWCVNKPAVKSIKGISKKSSNS